jgi:hypothetical protein
MSQSNEGAGSRTHQRVDVERHRNQVQENIVQPTPINAVPWGAESWTLAANNERRLESFHHEPICQIPSINVFKVEAVRITNTKLRRKFDNIRNTFELAKERQLNWLGHFLLHLPDSRQTKKLVVSAQVAHPRGKGQPHHPRHFFRKALIAVGKINEGNKKAAFNHWTTDIQRVMLEEQRAQSKKRLRQWMLEKD